MTGLVILDYVLVTWHFASQHFGVLCVYRVRAGRASSRALRRLDRAYALLVGGGLVVLAEVVSGTVYRIEVWVDPWLDPSAVEAHAGLLRGLGSGLAAGFALVLLALEARAERPSWPRAGYVLGLAAMTAVAFHARAPFVFLVLWSAQHWIVAIGLATLVARADPAAEPPRRAPLRGVNRRPWALLLVLVATSVVLLPVLEVEGADDDGALYAPRLFGDLAASFRTSGWAPALLALGLSTAFLHYWLDRAVYRFSNPLARGAARGDHDTDNAGSSIARCCSRVRSSDDPPCAPRRIIAPSRRHAIRRPIPKRSFTCRIASKDDRSHVRAITSSPAGAPRNPATSRTTPGRSRFISLNETTFTCPRARARQNPIVCRVHDPPIVLPSR
jgi:hypothetical protein